MADESSAQERDVHHALNEPATDPDPTEWPDPYDKRPDPRDPDADEPEEMDFGDAHPATGATSTSEPHHEVDPEVDPRKATPHEPCNRPPPPSRRALSGMDRKVPTVSDLVRRAAEVRRPGRQRSGGRPPRGAARGRR